MTPPPPPTDPNEPVDPDQPERSNPGHDPVDHAAAPADQPHEAEANPRQPGEAESAEPVPRTPAGTAAESAGEAPAETPAAAETDPAAVTHDEAADDPPPPPALARVRMETSAGSMLLEMLEDAAPRTAAHFLQLVHDGFYDGRSFHRIVPDFIVQGGCPYHDGTGGCGYTINPEFNDTPHEKGTVSMARTADPYSASSQFFICLSRSNCEHLDGQYTAFAKVIDGLEVLDTLAGTPLTNYELGTPADPPMIYHVYREDDPHAHYQD